MDRHGTDPLAVRVEHSIETQAPSPAFALLELLYHSHLPHSSPQSEREDRRRQVSLSRSPFAPSTASHIHLGLDTGQRGCRLSLFRLSALLIALACLKPAKLRTEASAVQWKFPGLV